MKELSLNVLDIACNGIKAGAKNISVLLLQERRRLVIEITDDGCGMTEETLLRVTDPFTTSRKTRKVGMGIPLIKLAAEQTGGNINIVSRHESEYPDTHGTVFTAVFYTDHIDCPPLGDIISTVTTLIQGSPHIDFVYRHVTEGDEIKLDTREMREILGSDISLSSPEIINWIADFLREEYAVRNNK